MVNSAMGGQAGADLSSLRAELDEIDRQLLNIVRERLSCCMRIASYKRESGVPMMQPTRIDLVQERTRDYAHAHQMSPEFLRSLYAVLISESCRVEDAIINSAHGHDIASSPAQG